MTGFDFHLSIRINPQDFRLLDAQQTKALMQGVANMLSANSKSVQGKG